VCALKDALEQQGYKFPHLLRGRGVDFKD
jgi:hypothetical protein